MPMARSMLPIQLNFSGSNCAPLWPISGASGTVSWIIAMVVPSRGACANSQLVALTPPAPGMFSTTMLGLPGR